MNYSANETVNDSDMDRWDDTIFGDFSGNAAEMDYDMDWNETMRGNFSGNSTSGDDELMSWDDATWVLISSFIIFTMQSGFGLLEAGTVSCKNQVNIMYKNTVDVVFGGSAYWLFGYAFSFGSKTCSNAFIGCGNFVVDILDFDEMGDVYVNYIFQLSFAATATTIVSGAVAERIKLQAYIIYSFFNIFTYAVIVHWIWTAEGWLSNLGVVDIAGSGVVHLCGGSSALVAAYMLGPRKGRYDNGFDPFPVGNGANIALGTIMIWWGWLGFNCGSTLGVQDGKWVMAARAAVITIQGAVGGGLAGVTLSLAVSRGSTYSLSHMCNGILGGLVSITASCALLRTWEGIVVGYIGGLLVLCALHGFDRLKIDDPVGAISVHGIGGIWGMLVVGLFLKGEEFTDLNKGQAGAFYGGGGYLLGVQLLACICISVWSGVWTFIIFGILKLTIGIRMSPEEEEIGADKWEHDLGEEVTEFAQAVDYERTRRASTVMGLGLPSNVAPKPHMPELPESLRQRRASSFLGFGYQRPAMGDAMSSIRDESEPESDVESGKEKSTDGGSEKGKDTGLNNKVK